MCRPEFLPSGAHLAFSAVDTFCSFSPPLHHLEVFPCAFSSIRCIRGHPARWLWLFMYFLIWVNPFLECRTATIRGAAAPPSCGTGRESNLLEKLKHIQTITEIYINLAKSILQVISKRLMFFSSLWHLE